MANLQPDGWDFAELKYVELSDTEASLFRLNRGDILFNRTNSKELVGKCDVFDQPGDWVFASYMIRLDLDRDQARPAFVSAYLNGPSGRAQIERDSRQIIGMTNINAEEIRALRIPLPSLPEQDALLAQLNAARAARDAGLRAADALLGGVDAFVLDALGLTLPPPHDPTRPFAVRFKDVSGSRVDPDYYSPRFNALRTQIEAGTYPVRALGDLCLSLTSGFAAGGDAQSEATEGVPHIRPTNILGSGELSNAGMKYVPASAAPARELIRQGEVLFNNTNSSAWVGKSTVFDWDIDCACSNHVTRLRLSDPRHSPSYLAIVLNAFRKAGYFAVLATNFNNQAGINAETLAALRIPVPDASEQLAIAAEVDRRRAVAKRLRADARASWDAARARFEEALFGPVE